MPSVKGSVPLEDSGQHRPAGPEVTAARPRLSVVTVTQSLDGRHLRSARTRAAILAAHRALIVEGALIPTTSRIAEAAGVSPRTFFSHFPDLEALFAATAGEVYDEVLARVRHVDVTLPLPVRAREFLQDRDEVYRFLAPFSLALRRREPLSPALHERRTQMAELSCEDAAATFAPEVALFAAEVRDDVVLGLAVSTGWSAWFHLSEELGLGSRAAQRVMYRLVLQELRVEP